MACINEPKSPTIKEPLTAVKTTPTTKRAIENHSEPLDQATQTDAEKINQNTSVQAKPATTQTSKESAKDPSQTAKERIEVYLNQKPLVTGGEAVEAVTKDSESNKRVVKGSKATLQPSSTKAVKKKALAPQMSFDEPTFDFGEIKEGDIVEHRFTFTNTGKSDLSIKDANVSCGCTFPSLPFLPIAAGDKGFIDVRFNSVNKSGAQRATVTINSNAANDPVELVLSGRVLHNEEKVDSTGGNR